ncbi:Dabb family protein [Algirhabdus cladophorae]|uniref:Dabb family protein n=1 Tax=Algirhabdus cladophorae TaxID=3377108 RepID=UPI003B84B3EA
MILHCVFCQFRAEADQQMRDGVMGELDAFASGLEGVISFDFGPNRDFEGKSVGFTDGFVIRFANRSALDTYAEHPTHKALGARLCALCVGGTDGIMVFDLTV